MHKDAQTSQFIQSFTWHSGNSPNEVERGENGLGIEVIFINPLAFVTNFLGHLFLSLSYTKCL